MTKEKKVKIRKWGLRIGIGALAFIGGLATTFFLVPGRVNVIHFDTPEKEVVPETHFSRFVTKVMNTIDVDNEQALEGIVGSIDDLTVEWPDNKVVVDGEIQLAMRNLNDFDATLDLSVNYNDKYVDLGIGYTDRAFYLAFQDLYIKSSYVKTQEVFEKLNHLFFNPEVPEEEGLGISVDLDGIIDSLLGDFDISSLTSGGSAGGLSLSFGEEKHIEDTNLTEAPLIISLGEDKDPIEIVLYLNEETDNLAGVNLKSVEIGDIKISGDIKIDIFDGRKVYALDNENFVGIHDYKDVNFIEVVNYQSWFDDIFNLLNKKTVGIDFSFSVDQDDGTGPVNIGQIDASIDVDASKFVLPIPSIIDADTFAKNDIVVEKSIKRGENGEETLVETILNNLNAGIDLSVNRDETHYADINLTYADENAYLSLNDDVLKTKMDNETLNFVIDTVSSMIGKDEDEQVRRIVRGEPKEEGLFDFITSSELITAIKDGHYEGIIDVIDSISNSDGGINLKLNLSSLGLGENAKVELNLDATSNGEKGVTSLKCSDIQMAEGIFNLDLETRDYKQANIEKVLNDKENYEELDFAIGVFDQVSGILDSKQAGFALDGSMRGADGLGMSFSGQGQLDYGAKYGFGDINIYNHNNPEDVNEKSETHPIKLYFDNTTEDKEANNMKLVYGPNGHLKGKLSVKSLDDVIGVVMKVFEKNDRRFAKFLDPVMKMINDSIIGQIIASKDYLQLSDKSFVKSIAQSADGAYLDVLLSKDLFAGFLLSDLHLRLNFDESTGVKKLASVQIVDLTLNETLGNKTINCTISVLDFDPDREIPLDLNETYMNFSSVATLLQFGIDSTELNVYHLTAGVKLELGDVLTVANIKLDFYIEVIGEDTKVYGMFPDIPYIIIASNDASTDVCSEFLFEPSKHYDVSSGDNIGGYFHIIRNEDHHGILERGFEQYYYRATSKGFVDEIANYLLSSVLDFRFALVDKIGNINLETSSGTAVYEDMFMADGFKYSENNGVSRWDVGMNLDKVSGIQALKTLKAELYGEKMTTANGEQKSYFNKLHGLLVVKASIVTINLDATILLEDINPNNKSWKDQCPDIDERFEKVCGVYNNMSDSDKTEFDSTYLNKPGKAKRVYLDSKMPSVFK